MEVKLNCLAFVRCNHVGKDIALGLGPQERYSSRKGIFMMNEYIVTSNKQMNTSLQCLLLKIESATGSVNPNDSRYSTE